MEILSRILCSRFKIIILSSFLFLIIIATYLFHLQINLVLNFFKLGQRNFLRSEKIASPRGNIVDAFGQLLATNRPVDSIFWQGTGKKTLTNDQVNSINQIISLLKLDENIIDQINQAEKYCKRLCLANDVNFEQLSFLMERFPTNPNVIIDRTFKRFYPQNSIASHIVGYLGSANVEISGKMGLELICNENLKGHSGEIIKTINSIGYSLESHEIKKALIGDTIQTTLNLKLQLLAEEIFPPELNGTCILMDPENGSLEVILSRPTFDPNIFLKPINPEAWKNLQEQKCFINRASNACYPPASIFKLVTLSAALETKIIEPNTLWYCIGHISFAGRLYHCNNRNGHGIVDTQQALYHSCNIPFFDIGKKIKIDVLADYAQRLGLGEKTNTIFNERSGLIPTNKWKKNTFGEPWWPGETLSATIGQSFLSVTPLQIACMISGICKGYLSQPRILINEPIIRKPVKIKKNTLIFLKRSMKYVTRKGTGIHLNTLKNFKIYGKTGTAQTRALVDKDKKIENEIICKEHMHHAWFVAYYRYKNFPPKTLVILLENAGSTRPAVRMAKKFFLGYAKILDQNTI